METGELLFKFTSAQAETIFEIGKADLDSKRDIFLMTGYSRIALLEMHVFTNEGREGKAII